ncbi:MAG: S41 family peptidase [Bacteroidia bacterium]|nr:S41 family peptidase [Bacteroidia bacterium]
MTAVLLRMHPAIGIYQPRMYYENLLSDFIFSLNDSLTEKQFRIRVKLILDELHCGHTEVMYSQAFYKEMNKKKLNYSPYIFLPVGKKLYLIANLSNKKQDTVLKKGTEILKINRIPVDSMINYSKHFVSTDGFNQTAKNHYVQIGFNSYYPTLFGRPDTFEVEYVDNKVSKSFRYKAIQPKTIPPLPLGPKDDSLYKKYKSASMKYRFLDDQKKTMVLRIERFSHRGDGRAYRRLFRKLKHNKSENLVIDLRNNGGGSLANSYRLLSYLIDSSANQTLSTTIRNYPFKEYTRGNFAFKFTRLAYKLIGEKRTSNDTDYFVYRIKPKKKNHFKGKVYVLINGGSFSASCLVSAYLKHSNRAVFIGEETGGAIEGCNAGITPYYKLPNTRIRVRVPAFRIEHDVCPEITGHGILPDYPTVYGLKDIMAKKDLELEKVKELIMSGK